MGETDEPRYEDRKRQVLKDAQKAETRQVQGSRAVRKKARKGGWVYIMEDIKC